MLPKRVTPHSPLGENAKSADLNLRWPTHLVVKRFAPGMQKVSPYSLFFSVGPMAPRTSAQQTGRAKRFALQFPVYFRQLDSPTWIEGRTENISYTGVLFQSASSLVLESKIELRVQVTTGPKGRGPTEIHGKGVVVRLEQRDTPKTPIALAVAMHGSRLVRHTPSTPPPPVGNA